MTDFFLKRLQNLLVIFAGTLLVFSFAPAHKGLLALVWPAVLLYLARNDTPWQAFRRGWLFGFGFFIAAVYWVWFSMHVFYGIPGLMSIAIVTSFGGYLALFPALAMGLSSRLGIYSKPAVMLLVFPVLWILFEWLRGWLMTGFPWVAIGYSQTDTVLSAVAPVLGIYGAGWLAVLVASTVAIVLMKEKRVLFVSVSIYVIVALFGWVLVCWLMLAALAIYALYQKQWLVLPATFLVLLCIPLSAIQWSSAKGPALKVSIVQGNIYQAMKWTKKSLSLKTYLELSAPLLHPVKEKRTYQPDLIIWPETALPYFYHEVEGTVIKRIQRILNERGSEMITGVLYRQPFTTKEGKKDRYDFNSVIKIGKTMQRYNKHHLVPYGEYVPMEETFDWLYKWIGLQNDMFDKASMDQKLLTVKGMPVAVNICYEAAFPEEIIQSLPQAVFLVNLSNNAWFYDPGIKNPNARIATKKLMQGYPASGISALFKQLINDSSEAYQVLQIARMRAIETSRYMLSSTNDGVTAIINHKGRVVKALPRFRPGVLNGSVQPMQGSTLFVMVGNYLVLCLMLLSLGFGIFIQKRGR